MKPGIKKEADILIEIGISTQYPGWASCEEALRPLIADAVHSAVEHSSRYPEIRDRNAEISIVLCDDTFIQAMNRDYRGKDKPTNVLSFPQTDFSGNIPSYDPLSFGDVMLAYQTISREAEEQEKSFEDHFVHLVVHGTLHLLGFDHETEAEAEEMENIEISILKEMGIENPYTRIDFMAE